MDTWALLLFDTPITFLYVSGVAVTAIHTLTVSTLRSLVRVPTCVYTTTATAIISHAVLTRETWNIITIDINRCIRVLATEIFGEISVASTRTHGRGEEMLLSSGWTLIRSELSSPNFNSSVRAERSFVALYLNAVIKPLWDNLDICLNYYFRSGNSVRVLSVATESERCFLDHAFRARSCAI